MTHKNVVSLTKTLVSKSSVTPEDKGCQQLIAELLAPLGFDCQHLRYDDVDNLWAVRGTEGPLFVFAGHTDVVPTGPVDEWTSPPFEPEERDGFLYGRGTADMKGSIAAILIALEQFIDSNSENNCDSYRIGLLITSDEEGPAKNGTVKVMEYLQSCNETIDWCLVGEPSSSDKVGDTIKNGRRGSLGGRLTIKGKQGHIAYPHLARNPIHEAMPALTELCAVEWDKGSEFFQPTSFQISNINAGTGGTNVIPGSMVVDFNIRFSTALTDTDLRTTIHDVLDKHSLNYDLDWILNGQPFLTSKGELIDATSAAIKSVTGYETELSTGGGTSDGRFIAPLGVQLIELGPCNATIHQLDESVRVQDLEVLVDIYLKILQNLSKPQS